MKAAAGVTAQTVASLVVVCVFAAVLPLYVFPSSIFDPTWTGWLMRGDGAQHFLAWHYFRDSPWTWPPGRILGYADAMQGSIVYADSIPLMALLLKPFSTWLPTHFQYTGFWIVGCYALQAAFAWRCGWLASGRLPTAMAFSLLALLSPKNVPNLDSLKRRHFICIQRAIPNSTKLRLSTTAFSRIGRLRRRSSKNFLAFCFPITSIAVTKYSLTGAFMRTAYRALTLWVRAFWCLVYVAAIRSI